jgi:hypothetical protein
MPGSIFPTINPATTSGTQLATLLNDFRDIVVSGFQRTPTRPSGLLAGGYWIDTSNEASPDFYWSFKIFDGTNDIEVFKINLDTASVSINGSENLFILNRESDDAVGPIYRLKKSRISGGGQVLSGDIIGELQGMSETDTGADVVTTSVKSIATENHTVTNQGSALLIEGINAGSASRTEWVRFQNGRLGIGSQNPLSGLHVVNNNGLLVEQITDDSLPVVIKNTKKRTSGNGQLLANDILFDERVFGVDENGDEVLMASTSIEINDDILSTGQGGAVYILSLKKDGETSPEEIFRASALTGVTFESLVGLNKLELASVSQATAASIIALNASKAIVNFTGATETELAGILATSATKVVVLHNNSTANLIVKHDDVAALAANRILLPKNKNIKVLPKSSIELYYHQDGNWRVKSGSGAGGAEPVVTSLTVATNAQITLIDEPLQTWVLTGNSSGANTLNVLPFGSTAPVTDGTEITLVGASTGNYVVIQDQDAAKGVLLNGASFALTRGSVITLLWVSALDRYVEKSRS